jgi:lysophospholipase L1-like esterase
MGLLFIALQNAVASDRTILVFGDSLSAAYGIRPEQGWVALLTQRLQAQEYGYEIINASVSGETTSGGLQRLPRALQLHRPGIVVLELGGNDGLRGLPLTTTRDNLGQMIRLSQQAGAQLLLVGIRMPPNYGPRYTEEFAGRTSPRTPHACRRTACIQMRAVSRRCSRRFGPTWNPSSRKSHRTGHADGKNLAAILPTGGAGRD